MATYNVTGVGGTTGHPSNGRTPYLVENTIDVSAVNGDSGSAQNDVLKCIDVPAETLIMAAGAYDQDSRYYRCFNGWCSFECG